MGNSGWGSLPSFPSPCLLGAFLCLNPLFLLTFSFLLLLPEVVPPDLPLGFFLAFTGAVVFFKGTEAMLVNECLVSIASLSLSDLFPVAELDGSVRHYEIMCYVLRTCTCSLQQFLSAVPSAPPGFPVASFFLAHGA